MYAHRIRNAQARNHQILVTLPSNFPDGAFEVIVVSEAEAPAAAIELPSPQLADVNALFDFLKTIPPTGRTREEIDREIQDERATWDR